LLCSSSKNKMERRKKVAAASVLTLPVS
jgi:hypothetical protein